MLQRGKNATAATHAAAGTGYRKIRQRATSSLISQPRQGVNNNFQMKTSNGQKYSNLTCVWTVFSWSSLEWTPYLPATWAVVKKSQFVNEQFCQLKFAPYWVDYGGCQLSRLLNPGKKNVSGTLQMFRNERGTDHFQLSNRLKGGKTFSFSFK